MIDFASAITTGVTVAGGLKGLDAIMGMFSRKNGKSNGFSRDDHDKLTVAALRTEDLVKGLDQLHDDMEDVKELLRR